LGDRAARVSGPAVAVTGAVIATGVLNMQRHIPNVGALLTTSYGRVVVLKVSLVVGALALGLLRRFKSEALALGGVLTAAGGLLTLPLPVTAPAASPRRPSNGRDAGRLVAGARSLRHRQQVALGGDNSHRAT